VGQLSKIETGKKVVTLRHFDTIRRAIGVPLSALFPEGANRYVITRRETVAQQLSKPRGEQLFTAARLADSFMGKRIEPFCLRNFCLPGDIELVAHDSEHFIFVLQGTLEMLQAEEGRVVTDCLKPGDALYWHCDVPHATRSPGRGAGYTEIYTVRHQTHGVENALYQEIGTRRLPGFRVAQRRDPVAESGGKIAFLRQAHGITAAKLAEQMGIGVRHLAAIESGRRAADVALLLRIARLFRRPVSYLLGADDRQGPARTITRVDALDTLTTRRRGPDTFVPLAEGMPDRAMHVYRARLVPSRPSSLLHHQGEMCMYVLQGEVEFRTLIDGHEVVEVLRAGDSLFADTSVPYDVRGYSRSPWHAPADAIQVFWNAGGTEPPIFDQAAAQQEAVGSPKREPRRRRSN
jgi:transcriptional regulator with XRE-family HTH domain